MEKTVRRILKGSNIKMEGRLQLGVMYAGALAATIVILAERLQFLWNVVSSLVSGS